MQTLKAIIIDDEQDAREILNMMIQDFCSELEVLETCSDGKQGVKAILKHNPDIVCMSSK